MKSIILVMLACVGLVSAHAAWAAAPTMAAAPASVPARQTKVVIIEHDALALSPAGDRVADVEASDPGNLPEDPHDHVVVHAADGKVLATYDPCKSCKYGATAWSSKGDLAFIATEEKAGKATLYVVANGKLRSAGVFAGVANTARWSPDGGQIALLATLGAHKKTGATEAAAPQVGEIGGTSDEQRIAVIAASGGPGAGSGAPKLISPADTYIYEFDWTPDGQGFVATGAKGDGDNNWWIATLDHVDARSGALRMIASPKMQMDIPRVSPDGKQVAFIGGLMSDWGPIGGDLYTVPMAGGTPTDVTPNFAGTFNGVAWRGNGILASALIGDRFAVVALGRVPQTLWSAPVTVKAQRFDGPIAFSADGTVAAAIMDDFTHAQEIALGRLPALAPITHDNVALGAQVSVQSVHWKNEGYAVQGWLIGPKQAVAGKKYPMVTVIHGGPSYVTTPQYIAAGGHEGANFDFDFAYDLIARGYYMFYPNPRGSYGEGEAFTRANIRDFGRGDLRDIMAGIDAVEKMAPVNDARLGLYGHSYGGWMAMWVNTQTHRFKALVAGAGIANWSSYYGENGIDTWMIPFFGASYYDDPAVYRAASPIEFIKNAKTPTFIYVGEHDVECPAPQSLEYWHALHALGTPTQLFIYAGEGHVFQKLANRQNMRARTIGWFERYLK